ncbi:hypothetical protein BO99DRAFT_427712 [Aspergillus violaceofuscus CBS 115571]|uniref:Uncharacterized protein n=1 Tax=Aspergillus violaceofuscus (strain CBS 115571) TaxID=1450538 RepID=A0A2V5HSS6_ASPV1|nr:hypothetical protein BO99DRAFT_427712 [Aspergillus violaceofuscus CBS 115571]
MPLNRVTELLSVVYERLKMIGLKASLDNSCQSYKGFQLIPLCSGKHFIGSNIISINSWISIAIEILRLPVVLYVNAQFNLEDQYSECKYVRELVRTESGGVSPDQSSIEPLKDAPPSRDVRTADPWAESAISLEVIHDDFMDHEIYGGLGFGILDGFLNPTMFVDEQSEDTPALIERGLITQTFEDKEVPQSAEANDKARDSASES